jgi:flagellar hook protein FlgE
LTFDPTTGDLSTVTDNLNAGATTAASDVPIAIPGGQTLALNISGTTQNAAASGVATANVNGSSSTTATGTVDITANGAVSAVYADGSEKQTFSIALVTVPSPDSLTPLTGNIWQLTSTAGTPNYATPGSTGMGTLKSSTLESSTTDLATQLTNMIQAQSGYEANSKVFQTGTTLLEDLVNLLK